MNGYRTVQFLFVQTWLVSITFFPLPSAADTPQFLWLKTAGGSGTEVSFSLAVDHAGNSLIAGYFNSTNISFGNGIVITNVACSASLPYDIFLAKYTSSGDIVWAKGIGGSDDDRARGIAVDSQGNCFVTGSFRSTNFVISGVYLTNSFPRGNQGIFVAKFDELGNLLWARGSEKGLSQSGSGIAADGFGDCCVAGSFSGTNTFGGTNLISRGNTDVLLLKYSPTGNLLWAKQAGGNDLDAGAAVAADASGNAYLLANIRGTNVLFDTYSFSAHASGVDQDMVAAKYDGNGQVIWAKQVGGTDLDTGRSIALDASGNCFITGDFYSTNLAFGTDILTNGAQFGFGDALIAKFDSSGDALWATSAHGEYADSSSACAVDFAGNSYIAGYFQSSNLVFGAVTITNYDTALLNDADAFIGKFTANGNLLWVSQIKGPKDQRAFAVGVDSAAHVYVTGWTLGTNVLFGAYAATNEYLDIYVAKIDSDFPVLQVTTAGNNAIVSWSTNRAGFSPQYSTNLLNPNSWLEVENVPIILGGQYFVTNDIDSEKKFYRLKR